MTNIEETKNTFEIKDFELSTKLQESLTSNEITADDVAFCVEDAIMCLDNSTKDITINENKTITIKGLSENDYNALKDKELSSCLEEFEKSLFEDVEEDDEPKYHTQSLFATKEEAEFFMSEHDLVDGENCSLEEIPEGIEDPEFKYQVWWNSEEDEADKLGLPKEVEVASADLLGEETDISDLSDEEIEDRLSNYLSDTYGYCHFGFEYKPSEEKNGVFVCYNIKWDTSEAVKKDETKDNITEAKFKPIVDVVLYNDTGCEIARAECGENESAYEVIEREHWKIMPGDKIEVIERETEVESVQVNEDKKMEPTIYNILGWLANHKEEYKDFKAHADKKLTDLTIEDIKHWISEHETLCKEYENFFDDKVCECNKTVTEDAEEIEFICSIVNKDNGEDTPVVKHIKAVDKETAENKFKDLLDSEEERYLDDGYIITVEEKPEVKMPEEPKVEEPKVEEPKDKVIDTFELPHEEYTEYEDLVRINNELGQKAKEGKLIGIHQDKDRLELAEPAINGIWVLFLNEQGGIKKIVLF